MQARIRRTCRVHLPKDSGVNNWSNLDSNRILGFCGSYDGTRADVTPQAKLREVDWVLPKITTDTVPACIMIPPRPEQLHRMPAAE